MNEPERTQWQTRCAFNGYCKRELKNEAINAHRQLRHQQLQEVTFSELTPHEEKQLYTLDTYFENEATGTCDVVGKKITKKLPANALNIFPEGKRNAGCRSPPLQSDLQTKIRLEKVMFDNTNHYTLCKKVIAGFTHYYVSFRDGSGKPRETEVSRTVYLEFLHFVKQERTLRRRDERYIEQSVLTQETLHRRAMNLPEGIEDAACRGLRDERLRRALLDLPGSQRRRFILHYDYGFTYERIAQMEGCTKMPIKRSIDRATEKLQKLLENFE